MIRAALLVSALLAGPVLVAPVFADGEPRTDSVRCGASREGMLACMAGRACLCRFERGGQLTGQPGGFRWDCGALRPDCVAPSAGDPVARDLPATLPPWAEPPAPR